MSFGVPSAGSRTYSSLIPFSPLNVAATGSDSLGDGSVGNPFLTIGKAISVAPISGPSVAITVGVGTFDLPPTVAGGANIILTGAFTASTVVTVAAVNSFSGATGLIIDVTGATVAADDYRGALFRFITGVVTNVYFRCYYNSATDAFVPGETRLYCVEAGIPGAPAAPNVGDTAALQLPSTVFNWATSTALITGAELQLARGLITSTGAANPQILAGRLVTSLCAIDSTVRLIRPESAAELALLGTYVANQGSTTAGMIRAKTGMVTVSRGTVIDGVGSIAGARYLNLLDGQYRWSQQTVFRSMERIQMTRGSALIDSSVAPAVHDTHLFETASGVNCTKAFVINSNALLPSVGGGYDLPVCHGAITGNYFVEATRTATVDVNGTSTITTALGTSTVSGNDGVSNQAWGVDGTQIFGGSPARPPLQALTFTATKIANYTAVAGEAVNYDPAAGTFTITMPAAADRVVGDCVITKNMSGSATAITVDGNGANIEAAQSAPGTFPGATTSIANAGISILWVWNGTTWGAS